MKGKNESKLDLAEKICIWNEGSNCSECNLDRHLSCKPQWKYTIYFGIPAFFAFGVAGFGLLFAPLNIFFKVLILGGWIAYSAFFFAIWESRMLCNHCPYYANENQKVLHCPTDRGKLKTGKYNPGPINTSEKIQFSFGTLILIGFPALFLFISSQLIFLLLYTFGVIIWIVVIQLKVCPDCLNFSCPLNRVPESIRNEFLNQNPIIKSAWEKAGYKID